MESALRNVFVIAVVWSGASAFGQTAGTAWLLVPAAQRGAVPFDAGIVACPKRVRREGVVVYEGLGGEKVFIASRKIGKRWHLEGRVHALNAGDVLVGRSATAFRGQAASCELDQGVGRWSGGEVEVQLHERGFTIENIGLDWSWKTTGRGGGWEVLGQSPLRTRVAWRQKGRALEVHLELHQGIGRVDVALAMDGGANAKGMAVPSWLLQAGGASLDLGDGKGGWWRAEGDRALLLQRGDRGMSLGGRGLDGFVALRTGRGPAWSLTPAPDGGEAFAHGELELGGQLALHPGAHLEIGEGRVARYVLSQGLGRAPSRTWGLATETKGLALGGVRLPQDSAVGQVWQVRLGAAITPWFEDERFGPQRSGASAGDWPMFRDEVGNLEYDTAWGLLLRYRSGSRGPELPAARAALDHQLTRDRDARGTGLFFPHGAGHRSGDIEPGHHWIAGLCLAARWSGAPWLGRQRDQVLRDQVRTMRDLELQRLTPRSLGWGLWALCIGLGEAPDKRGIKLLRRWRRHLLDQQGAHDHLELVPARGVIAGRFVINPYVEGGIILPALARSLRIARSPRDASAVAGLRRALLRDALVADVEGRTRLVRRIDVQRREARPVGKRGQAPGEDAALFVAGLRLAGAPLSGRLAELERSIGATCNWPRRRARGRELSVLLRSIPWF